MNREIKINLYLSAILFDLIERYNWVTLSEILQLCKTDKCSKNETGDEMRPENPVWGKQRRREISGGSRQQNPRGLGSLCSDEYKPSSQASRNAFNRPRRV